MTADPFDIAAFVSLAILVLLIGLTPASAIMPLWIRMRHQVVLIWMVPCLRRGCDVLGLRRAAVGLHQASAVVSALVACWVVYFMLREARRARRSR